MKKDLIIRGVVILIALAFILAGWFGDKDGETFFSENGLDLAYTYTLIAVFAAVVFATVMTIITDPKRLIKPLAAIVVLAVLFFVGYSMAEGQVHNVKSGADIVTVSAETSRWVEAALNTFYIIFGIAIVGVIFNEVSKIFK